VVATAAVAPPAWVTVTAALPIGVPTATTPERVTPHEAGRTRHAKSASVPTGMMVQPLRFPYTATSPAVDTPR